MTTEQKQEVPPQQEVLEPKKMKSRRVIKLLYSKCPLCHLKLTLSESLQADKTGVKQYFQLVQFGTNPDGTGYESYKCDYCERFYMVIISGEPIIAEYNFKPPKSQQKPKSIFEELFGGLGGNGQGGPM